MSAPADSRWLPGEVEFLRERFPHCRTQLVADALKRSYAQVARKAHKLGLTKSEAYFAGPDSTRLTGRKGHVWTPEQLAYLREHFADQNTQVIADALGLRYTQVSHQAKVQGLKKSEAFLNGPCAGRTGSGRGASSRFRPGHVTWSKGMKFPDRPPPANAFAKGQKPSNYMPLGSFRLTGKPGKLYLQIKLHETGYPPTDWVMYHRHVWEQAHGPLPPKHIVVFKGPRSVDPKEITLERLECISMQEHMRRHTFHQYGPEVAALTRLRGQITRQINKQQEPPQEGPTP